jgi:predicted nucleic acid-binding protein
MEKHKDELLKKSKMRKHDFNELLNILLQKVIIIPSETLLPYK